MPPTNSKNCVARTTVYGIGEALINFSWATFARKYPLAGSRSQPTIESAMWWPTPVFFSAARRLRVEVSKNSSTALSSQEGAFVTSTTTCASINASVKPSTVIDGKRSDLDEASGPALKCVSVFCHGTLSLLISVSLDLVAGGQSLKFLKLVATPKSRLRTN